MKQQLLRGLCLLFVCLATAFASSTMLTSQVLPQSPIGVDIPGVGTKYFRTLDEAFSATKKANKDGCTIHIPSGSYPLSYDDSVRLNRRVNIFGAGAKGEGKTIVDGSITLLQGADGSLIQGLRVISGGISISSSRTLIRNMIIAGSIYFTQGISETNRVENCCLGGYVDGGEGNHVVVNTIAEYFNSFNGGVISNCIAHKANYHAKGYYDYYYTAFDGMNRTTINNCISLWTDQPSSWGNTNRIRGCVVVKGIGHSEEEMTLFEDLKPEDLYVRYNTNAPWDPELNDWHLKSDSPAKGKGVNGSDPGIYGGAGFDDKMMSPLPRIVITEAPVKTNAEGKLILKVRIDQN